MPPIMQANEANIYFIPRVRSQTTRRWRDRDLNKPSRALDKPAAVIARYRQLITTTQIPDIKSVAVAAHIESEWLSFGVMKS